MDETILFPSPNWFQVSGLAVSSDGWLVYGGPSKSLCVLEPLPADYKGVVEGSHRFRAHVLNRAHPDKIVSVDISPKWPEKRLVLTGSANGSVKQWCLEQAEQTFKIKSNLSHDVHTHEKEDIIGVAYSNEVYAVTVGSFGNMVKWDLNSNVVKTYSNILKTFKPVSMACSYHTPLNVAIGTKQGVLFVVDLSGDGTILYKVRSQDDEIMNVSWCPQFEVQVEKSLDESSRPGASGPQSDKEKPKKFSAADRLERIRQQKDPEDNNASGIVKNLPEDSFDSFEVVQEDDMFDIYKDHEAEEFGHKKYESENILVKTKEPEKEIDYLAECLKLKEDILNKKSEPEPTIESLVEKMEKTDINSEASNKEASPSCSKEKENFESNSVSSVHLHKHLLATIGKQSGVRIWSKSGKLVGSCALTAGGKNSQMRYKNTSWATLVWCKPDLLLIADGKNQLLKCNPLKINAKNKLETKLVHSVHKRGVHCVASNAARRAAASAAWTVSQDRSLARYSLDDETTAVYSTCGGFLYNIQACPYDASKVAISVGDGAVRVWTSEESDSAEGKLTAGRVATYWQHVQGKVLTVAWHPTKENLLAFGTAESRVGLIDASGTSEKAARALPAALSGGVYSLCWGGSGGGGGARLLAAARGVLLAYRADAPDDPPTPIPVQLEGAAWAVSAARARGELLAVGSEAGGVAVLGEAHTVLAAAFPFNKIIHTIEWHPEQTSLSSEESPNKNLLAVCSQDKANTVVILEFGDKEEGGKKLVVRNTLSGHSGAVLQVAWSPHREARLLSTSHDGTVRVWDVAAGACESIFGGHRSAALAAAWGARPALAHAVLSGGTDCCLRLWDARDHPAATYTEIKPDVPKKDKRKKKDNKEKKNPSEAAEESIDSEDTNVAATLDSKIKASKKFLLPMITKQMVASKIKGAKRMLHKYLVKKGIESPTESEEFDLDYIKMFGSSNEVKELFELEMERHLQFGNTEAWIVLSVFRGHIDAMMQYASEKNLLCPYLLSIAPSVSSKYWKDASKLYLAQIDRLVANGEEEKLVANRNYGGPVYRKAVTLLSLQDVKRAVSTLCEARLFKEAYILCRIRYIDTIADEVLAAWARNCIHSGLMDTAAMCYIALENLLEAATVLGKCNDQDSLSLAADLARAAGQTILSDNITNRKTQMQDKVTTRGELFDDLPSRIALLMKDIEANGRDETCKGAGDGVNVTGN